MYTLLRSVPISNLLAMQAPALLASFIIAEVFYKFKSFTLECLAFLVTWFVIDAVLSLGRNLLVGSKSTPNA
jgi:hypothetical protein